MFSGCKNLLSLNLNHFITTKVQYMNEMFQDCEKLKQLNISQLKSDSIGTMYRMFYGCRSLEYLNLFPLIEKVESINEMFTGTSDNFKICIQDIKNIPNIFEIIKNKNIKRDCSEDCYGEGNNRTLIESQKRCCPLYYNGNCYYECPGKTRIDEDNPKICNKFNCDAPKYYNFEQNNCDYLPIGYYVNDTIERTIDKCHEDCTKCYDKENDISKKCLKCKNDNLYVYLGNCQESCRYGYFIKDDTKICKCHRRKCKECTEESLKYNLCVLCNEQDNYYRKSNDNSNKNGFINCYKKPEGYYLDRYNIYQRCYYSCKYCSEKYPDKFHHFCINCNEDNSYPIKDKDNPDYFNCYPKCKFNYFFDENHNYICTNTSDCPSLYPYLLENTTECIKECNDENKWLFRHTCFEQCPFNESKNYTNGTGFYCNASCPFDRPFEMTETQYCVSSCTIMERYYKKCFTNFDGNKEENSQVQDMVLNDYKDDIIDTFNYTFISETQNIIQIEKNVIYEITSTNCTIKDQRITTIDLGDCEDILKDYYGIDKNESLYIFKIDAFVEGKTGPKVEYEVYYPFDEVNLHLLDLSICEGKQIFIGYPLNISQEELDLYNSKSDYYNDICYTYTNSKGADVILNDRQNEFMNNNRSLCDEDCKFSGYNIEERRLICSCEIKYSISIISQIKIDKNKLYNFINLKQIANFSVMKCIKLLFSIIGIKTNIGFYSFFPTIIVYIITLFVFYLKEIKRIMHQIDEIIAVKKLIKYSWFKEEEPKKKKNKVSFFCDFIKKKGINLETIIEKVNKRKQYTEIDNDINIKSGKNKNDLTEDFSSKLKKFKKKYNDENNTKENDKKLYDSGERSKSILSALYLKNKKKIKKLKKKYLGKDIIKFFKNQRKLDSDSTNKTLFEAQQILEVNKVKKEILTLDEKLKIIEVLKFNDNELNDLGYKKAFKYDRRTFFQYYISLLFTKLILFQIFNTRDYNAYSIKVLLFFFNFSSCYAVNALFFNDDTMHQIYEDEGDFNFIYQLPQIAYSTIISYFVDNITTFLALSEDNILQLKQDKKFGDLKQKSKRIKNTLKIKFIFFFIVNFILILLFWYYLGCFCAVYKNTQFHLIKDTLISFGMGFITPFGTNIITALIRIYSLKRYTQGNKTLFRLSRLLQQYL